MMQSETLIEESKQHFEEQLIEDVSSNPNYQKISNLDNFNNEESSSLDGGEEEFNFNDEPQIEVIQEDEEDEADMSASIYVDDSKRMGKRAECLRPLSQQRVRNLDTIIVTKGMKDCIIQMT